GEVGRWIARDPIRFAGGHNVYLAFVADPVNRRDPTGLYTFIPNEACDLAEGIFPEEGHCGGHMGDGDAFRHCYASCRFTQDYGEDVAEWLSDFNEGDDDSFDSDMDRCNDAVGREIGADDPD